MTDAATSTTSERERLAWAVLFSLPVGVGIGLAVSKMAVVPLWDPFVVGTGLVVAVALFAFMWVATSAGGDDDPNPD